MVAKLSVTLYIKKLYILLFGVNSKKRIKQGLRSETSKSRLSSVKSLNSAYPSTCRSRRSMIFMQKNLSRLDNNFLYFSSTCLYFWALAGPNIAEKGAALVEKAPGRVRDGFGTVLGIRILRNAGLGS